MAVLKCKMCGGNLNIEEENVICECEFCGTQQTVPKLGNDANIADLFNRANDFRASYNFDKAEHIYEQIIESNPNEAEAYWGLILCKFGIEYVKDPKTMIRVPTCHRSSYDPIVTDVNYKNAIKYADAIQKPIYEAEAAQIDEIQKGILTLARDEEPYDVFICYKETDQYGKRTQDSVLANDIYYQLTTKGYKVFYAAITLEDKLGSAYEPCIFAALNSAKIMLAIGTKPEYFRAVWVKNEWSRFLQIIKNDMKKVLIPCYRDMDAYDLPEEFAHLQALDMTKIGFISDIERACERICDKKQADAVNTVNVQQNVDTSPATSNLIRRMFNFIADGDTNEANEYAEKILDIDSDCGEAYIGKLLIDCRIKSKEEMVNVKIDTNSKNYRALMRTTDENAKNFVLSAIETRNSNLYNSGLKFLESSQLEEAISVFNSLGDYKDSVTLAAKATKDLADFKNAQELARKQKIYNEALERYNIAVSALTPDTFNVNKQAEILQHLNFANTQLLKISEFSDSVAILEKIKVLRNELTYLTCVKHFEAKAYSKVIELGNQIKHYKDTMQLIEKCEKLLKNQELAESYEEAVSLFEDKKYRSALSIFTDLGDYEDAGEMAKKCRYCTASELSDNENFKSALVIFEALGDYADSAKRALQCKQEIKSRDDAYEKYLKKYPLARQTEKITNEYRRTDPRFDVTNEQALYGKISIAFYVLMGIFIAFSFNKYVGGGFTIFMAIVCFIPAVCCSIKVIIAAFKYVFSAIAHIPWSIKKSKLDKLPKYNYEVWKNK